MKKNLILLFTFIVLVSIPRNFSYAKQGINRELTISTIPTKMDDISIRASDVIVYKYRVKNGVAQYRRWNQTRGYWVDSTWINL